MNSLVLELQSEALDPSSSVLNLLRKASLIAYKLNIQELQEWANFELKGYEQYSQVPKYRFIESDSKFKQKVINAVKTGSLGALEKAIDNPIGAFVIEGIKGWQEIE